LITSAAAGFAAGLIFVLAKRYSDPARSVSLPGWTNGVQGGIEEADMRRMI
jgi:hypothetical protein